MSRFPKIKPFAALPIILVVLLAAFGIYGWNGGTGKTESPVVAAGEASLKPFATGTLAGFLVHAPRKPVAPFSFKDGTGADVSLAKWQGKVVLLNLWATWCTPCRKEMPDLADLQRQLGGADFEVVALSIDRKGAAASQAFLTDVGAGSLALYIDVDSASLQALQALGLPATLLIDRKGLEAGRLLGPAQWSAPEAVALIKAAIAE